MENTAIYLTVIYLLIYRLAVLLLGSLSIYLGYRLFIKGFDQKSGTGEEMSAQFGTVSLSLKNASPGIFFATFGVAITTVILMASPPQFNYNIVRDQKTGLAIEEGWDSRGDGSKSNMGSSDNETKAAGLHEKIWKLYYAEALQVAQQVIELAPADPNYRDTLAALYLADGNFSDAVEQQKRAIENAKQSNVTEEEIAKLEKKLKVYGQFLE